jgi:hypothetical protein
MRALTQLPAVNRVIEIDRITRRRDRALLIAKIPLIQRALPKYELPIIAA